MIRKNHRERIYDKYLKKIRSGEITHEDRLIDNTIAAELGVSRMPVRDALMRLTHEGYLVGTTRGFMLPALTAREVAEVFEIRRLLEPRAVARACHAMTEAQIEVIAVAVADAETALATGDIHLLYRSSDAVRSGWLSAVPNHELREAINRYLIQVQSVRMATMLDPNAQHIIVAGQKNMLTAFRNRDSVAASEEMLRFVLSAERSYQALTPDEVLPEE